METVNVRFDETNGSQKEHLPHDLDEPPLDEVIRSMAIGEIRPVKTNPHQANRDDDDPMFPQIARGAGCGTPAQSDRFTLHCQPRDHVFWQCSTYWYRNNRFI